MRRKIGLLALLAIFLITSGFGCKTSSNTVKQDSMQPIKLTYWRVFDGPDAFDEIIKNYKSLHPNVSIEYRKLRFEEYEQELINALAEDRGPDIFSIHNTWVNEYQTKIEPMPETTTMVFPVETGSVKKEISYQKQIVPSISLGQIRDNFVDVVSKDVILEDGKVYGLPLSVDTLAMYYNKDLLNNAGISQPPAYWNREFLQAIKKLTKQDPKRGLIQSGVAMGGSSNIERYSDILSLLMMQNGASMVSDDSKVSFQLVPEFAKETGYNPGLEALRFYTDFANPTKESYSWNDEMANSLEMFIGGNLALMFGYSYNYPVIKTAAPKLNFSVTKFPQIEGNPPTNINFANYWVETVSKKSEHKNEAWNFVQFMTSPKQVESYLTKAKKPTALRALVQKQKDNDEIGVFAEQVLTAKSWYHGKNAKAMELVFKEVIDAVVEGSQENIDKIIINGAAKVQQTMY